VLPYRDNPQITRHDPKLGIMKAMPISALLSSDVEALSWGDSFAGWKVLQAPLHAARKRARRECRNDGVCYRGRSYPQELPRSGFVVCRACSVAWGCKSPVQPDGGEALALLCHKL
jgi:hypothetical protein